MKCNNCGNEVESGNNNCPYCGTTVVEPVNQSQFVYPNDGNQANANYGNNNTYNTQKPVVDSTPMLIWAIINTVCCCLPIGIAAIIFAVKIGSSVTQEEADKNLKTTKTLNIIGTVGGLIVNIIVGIGYSSTMMNYF